MHDRVGVWIGVALSKAHGTCNGSVDGKRYFRVRDGFGAFYAPDELAVVREDESDSGDGR